MPGRKLSSDINSFGEPNDSTWPFHMAIQAIDLLAACDLLDLTPKILGEDRVTESIFRYLQTIYDYAINYPEDFGNDALVSRIKDGSAFANTSDCCYLYSRE